MWGIAFQFIVSLLAWLHVLFSRIRNSRFCFCSLWLVVDLMGILPGGPKNSKLRSSSWVTGGEGEQIR
ncbi:hypothetical protein BDV30DRAFT_213086 [Aspergillus minisclerotigenes]|uniref:Uncharacterized protein n=1 Tax=Aspergillus minisclerotigenes TaxID=656917 RepID=A0A5N6IZP0_9EURO|nr:hypothetical protein BDV30DRAFT_213086 [Aspergillus minisclerotigenes]